MKTKTLTPTIIPVKDALYHLERNYKAIPTDAARAKYLDTLSKDDRARLEKTLFKPKHRNLNEIHELQQLTRAIKSGHECTQGLVKSAQERSCEALAEAIICGGKLVRAKELIGYGGFMNWCKSALKEISHQTINNYMALYNAFGKDSKGLGNLPATNLHKAYKILGIVKEDDLKPDAAVVAGKDAVENKSSSNAQTHGTLKSQSNNSASASSSKPIHKGVNKTTIPQPTLTKGKTATRIASIEPGVALSRAKFLASELTKNLITVYQFKQSSLKEIEDTIITPLLDAVAKLKKP